ncbi:MAG: hypothetical protein NZL96_01190 [Patescibacteria group bacterium]|nr:hypothetical protein [Patescibacteria group bacterium]
MIEARENFFNKPFDFSLIDQIKAAGPVAELIEEMKRKGLLSEENSYHKPIIETDVYRLRRGLCLPCASAVAINILLNRRVVGDDDGILSIADMHRLLLPHHGKYPTTNFPCGWLVVNDKGDMYHHAIAAFAEALEINTYSLLGFKKIDDLINIMEKAKNSAIVVSFNNRFVLEQTLKNYPDSIKKDGDKFLIKVSTPEGDIFKPFENGRHAVTILNFSTSSGELLVADSFNLPQTKQTKGILVRLSLEEATEYLKYHDNAITRAIVFSQNPDLKSIFQDLLIPYIPKEVKSDLSSRIDDKKAQIKAKSLWLNVI